MRITEDVHVGVLGQIGGEPDDLRAFVGQPDEGVAERGAGGLLTGSANEAIIADVVGLGVAV